MLFSIKNASAYMQAITLAFLLPLDFCAHNFVRARLTTVVADFERPDSTNDLVVGVKATQEIPLPLYGSVAGALALARLPALKNLLTDEAVEPFFHQYLSCLARAAAPPSLACDFEMLASVAQASLEGASSADTPTCHMVPGILFNTVLRHANRFCAEDAMEAMHDAWEPERCRLSALKFVYCVSGQASPSSSKSDNNRNNETDGEEEDREDRNLFVRQICEGYGAVRDETVSSKTSVTRDDEE